MRTLVRNGTVYLEDEALVTDVLVEGGRIADIGRLGAVGGDCETIDAAGRHVLPGLIDIHTHLDDTIGRHRLADTWATGSEAAIVNGITTLGGFITQGKDAPLRAAVEEALPRAAGHSHCDYAFHLTPVGFGKGDWAYVERLLGDGFRSFKFYTTYREAGLYLDYGKLREAMQRIGDMGATVLVHCEDDEMLRAAKAAVTDPANAYGHAISRPAAAEVEAIGRVLELSARTKCRTHIVHVSTAEGAELIAQARQDLDLSCETCPQYLCLADDLLKGENGHRFICSPPLRSEQNAAAMRSLALRGTFDAYATDHCAFRRADKDAGRSDYAKVPNGLAGIGALVPLINQLHSDLQSLATHLALNPAKAVGLYPRKGAIRKGADADLIILDPDGGERTIQSSLADVHETYPGQTTRLDVRRVMLRGETVVRDGALINRQRFTGKRA